jgi:hypothetical protein
VPSRQTSRPLAALCAVSLAHAVAFAAPSAQVSRSSGRPAAPPATIDITVDDLVPREIENMTMGKRSYAQRAGSLVLKAPQTSNTVAYAREYLLLQDDMEQARRLRWWDLAPEVDIPDVPVPSAEAMAELVRENAEEERQKREEEARLREEERRLRELALKERESEARAEAAQKALAIKQAELEEQRRLNDLIEDYGWYTPTWIPPVARPPVIGPRPPIVTPRPHIVTPRPPALRPRPR